LAIDDKKQYKTCLKLLSTTATSSSLANKLSDVSVDAEDPKLQQAAKRLANLIRPKHGEKDPKINIVELANRFKHSATPGHKQHAIDIQRMHLYCESAVQSDQPAWQVIALAHGWTPPASAKSD
jgi:hypothetical protein